MLTGRQTALQKKWYIYYVVKQYRHTLVHRFDLDNSIPHQILKMIFCSLLGAASSPIHLRVTTSFQSSHYYIFHRALEFELLDTSLPLLLHFYFAFHHTLPHSHQQKVGRRTLMIKVVQKCMEDLLLLLHVLLALILFCRVQKRP